MDVSALFRASVKCVSLRNKDLGENDAKALSKKSRQNSVFCTKARGVVTQISKLRDLLLEKRNAYLNFSNHLVLKERMTDEERDRLDVGAHQILNACSKLIKELKRELVDERLSQQNLEHREIMILLIDDYLRSVCKIYSERKALRMKKAIQMRKLTKLEPEPKLHDEYTSKLDDNKTRLPYQQIRRNGTDESGSGCTMEKNLISADSAGSTKVREINGEVDSLGYDEELSPEDAQMFESENEQLYNELNTVTEEIKQIESKVVRIAELQDIFTEKVMDQDRDLEKLMTTVVGSTENVKEANEQIRQAIQRNAGLRVWILLFLLVMSFSLLFLDWYNP